MKNLLIFLLIALISTYLIKPKDKSKIWISSSVITLISLIIYGLLFYLMTGSLYFVGQEIVRASVPAIISGVVLYFQLKKKIENNNILVFPVSLVIILGISFIVSTVGYSLGANHKKSLKENRKFIEEFSIKKERLYLNSNPTQKKFEINKGEINQAVNYKQIKFKLPSNWSYKSQEIESNFSYQISCWEKGGPNSFVFQWIETEWDLEEYMEVIKESIKEQATHKNTNFSSNQTGFIQNNKTLFSTFTGKISDFKFSGKLITFNNNDRTFLIMYQGDEKFYNSHTHEKIISTLKTGFITDTVKKLTKSKIPNDWTLYEIENIGQIAVPPTLELRDDNSWTALAKEIVNDNIITHKKIEINKSQLVFQPKGTDKFTEEALSKYARIMIYYSKGEPGDFYKWNKKFDFSDKEYKELNEYYKNELDKLMTTLDGEIIEWYPLKFGNINGLSYMKVSFTRQTKNNPIVKVIRYNFFNWDEAMEITLSYRLSEMEIWASDFNKVINTFEFKSKK